MALSEAEMKLVIRTGITVVENVIRDLWQRSNAKKSGMTFDDFLAAKLANQKALEKYSTTPKFQKPRGMASILGDYISENLRPITFSAQDKFKALDEAGTEAAKRLLRAIGLE